MYYTMVDDNLKQRQKDLNDSYETHKKFLYKDKNYYSKKNRRRKNSSLIFLSILLSILYIIFYIITKDSYVLLVQIFISIISIIAFIKEII